MKQLLAGAALLFVIGIAGFLYRNTVERPWMQGSAAACTMEAKMCPDGTSVAREGPSCDFPACTYPNVDSAEKGIAFAVPDGYIPDEQAYGADTTLVLAFKKPESEGQHVITVRSYPIREGESADSVIIANTRYQPADLAATDLSRFETAELLGKTFRATVVERFEGLVTSSYFLVREGDVLRFDITEQGVTRWTDADLDVTQLPGHQSLLQMLRTLQATP